MNITAKEELSMEIIKACDKLTIAKYLKNELKESLKYFHTYKLKNIKDNLAFLKKYLLYLNEENCKNIESLEVREEQKHFNNVITYFYNKTKFSSKERAVILQKIESNHYKIITMMQGVKGLLLLTIDEICNASPTRMSINSFLLEQASQQHKKQKMNQQV